jgi:hypothetical protein
MRRGRWHPARVVLSTTCTRAPESGGMRACFCMLLRLQHSRSRPRISIGMNTLPAAPAMHTRSNSKLILQPSKPPATAPQRAANRSGSHMSTAFGAGGDSALTQRQMSATGPLVQPAHLRCGHPGAPWLARRSGRPCRRPRRTPRPAQLEPGPPPPPPSGPRSAAH